MYYLLGGLCIFGSISFIRFLFLYHKEKYIFLKTQKPYNVGGYLKSLRRKHLPPDKLPGEDQKPQVELKTSSKKSDRILPVTPVFDSVWRGFNTINQYMCIDDNMYEGVSRLSNETMHNFSDLSARLKTYERGFFGLTKGSFNKVKGHVAESHVAEHFKEAGMDVQWPETSNQKGFDLLLNGNPIQVKCREAANNLVEHFKQHPHIPVVVPADAENIPENAFHFDPSESTEHLFDYLKDNPENAVIVDSVLSHEGLTESVEQGTDLATGAVDLDVPWVTVAFSGWRELDLLMKNDTDIFSSVEHIALDVAGVGVGMAVGRTVGAIVGSIVPGPGTVVGAITGGVGGAMLGRMITNEIKNAPLEEAIKAMKKSRRKLNKKIKEVKVKYNNQLNAFKKTEQSKLNQKSSEAQNLINHQVQELRFWTVRKEKCSQHLKNTVLNGISNTMGTLHIKQKLSWVNFLWPDRNFIKSIMLKNHLLKYITFLNKQFKPGGRFLDRGTLFKWLADKGLCREYVLSDIQRVEKERQKHETHLMSNIKKSQNDILNLRYNSMKSIGLKIKEHIKQTRQELAPYIEDIKRCRELVKEQAKKLGKKVA